MLSNRAYFTSDALIWSTVISSVCLVAIPPAMAGTFSVLHSFCAQQLCADGADPEGPLLRDAAGDIFGTTLLGGNSADAGIAFEMTLTGDGTYHFTVLNTFCQQANCADGEFPAGSLIMDTSGDLYGVTSNGGANGDGEAFELLPGKGNWKLKVLYNFCSLANCEDGGIPVSGLTYAGAASGGLYDGSSPLYGTTTSGGGSNYSGVAYSLQPAKRGWSEQVIFRISNYPGGGSQSPLIMDSSGNLYGTELNNYTAFELSPSNGRWTETVLDDKLPYPDGLVMVPSGTIWGLTHQGGARCHLKGYGGVFGCGSIYSLTPGEGGYTETTWHAFCVERNPHCTDGALPWDTPVLDSQGNLFGTTWLGGSFRKGNSGGGTLFELSSDGTFSLLHTFCEHARCPDGITPFAGVTIDSSGNLYGAAEGGGKHARGVVYKYAP